MARLYAKWNKFSERGQTWYHFWQDTPAPVVPPTPPVNPGGGGYIAISYRRPKKTIKPYEEVVIFDDHDMVAIFEKFLEVEG